MTQSLENALEKRLKKIFLSQLEEYILKLPDDIMDKWVDRIIESSGKNCFRF